MGPDQGGGQTRTRMTPTCPPYLQPESIARKRQSWSRLWVRSFSTGCTRASHWRYGDAAHRQTTHLLARDRISRPTWIWTSSRLLGALFLRLAPLPAVSRVPGPVVFWCVVVPVSPLLAPGCFAGPALPPQPPMEAHHSGAPGGLALVLLCSLHLPSPLPLAHSAFSALLFGAPRPRFALGLSRVMGPAGSGRSAAPLTTGSPSAHAATAAPSVATSPSHQIAASLLRSACLASASNRARTHSRSPAPLPKRAPRRSSSTASGLRGSVALAETGLVTGLVSKCCPPGF